MSSTPDKTVEQLSGKSEVQDSVFLHAWNLMNNTTKKKSTVALVGSDANMLDVLTELEIMEEDLKDNDSAARRKSVSNADARDAKKCFSGINCVLGDEEKNFQVGAIPSYHRNVVYDYDELVRRKPDKYAQMELDPDFTPHANKPHYNHSGSDLQKFRDNIARSRRSDYLFQSASTNSRLNSSSKSPSPSGRHAHELENRGITDHVLVPPVLHISPHTTKSTSGDNCLTPDDIRNQNAIINRNNININLTFAMGQYQNSARPDPYYDVEEIKAPRRRAGATQRKEKAETSIQTDREDITPASQSGSISPERTDASQLDFDLTSTSTFPSVTPSFNYQNRSDDSQTTVCIPENKVAGWNEYFDIPGVVAYTGDSMKSIIDTADHIINNFIIMPDDNLYTEEELDEGEGKLGISLLRLLGVPQQFRHSIYNEALHDVQAIRDISTETVSVINHVIDWLCDGDGEGKEKLINRVRRLASVTTDFQPDSDAWVQFESEFGIFTETVGEVMKQGYEASADVARRFSETILEKISPKTADTLAILPTHSVEEKGNTPAASVSRRVSGVQMQPSLSSIVEESEVDSGKDTLELEAERETFEKLKEAFRKIEAELEADVREESGSGSTLNEFPTWVSESLKLEVDSKKIHHGSNPREWKRDAFMEAPIPEPENSIIKAFNSICDAVTSSFVKKTKSALLRIHGSGMTPILGESQCNSRDERVDTSQANEDMKVEEGQHLPSSEIQFLAAEIQKLAMLTDSYFIDPKDDLKDVQEPEEDCPPPPVPKRQPSSIWGKTVMSIDIDEEILLEEENTGCTQVSTSVGLTEQLDLPAAVLPDSNDNSVLPEESPLPQISDLMQKLKKFWPNKALSMILTPEAQLQFAMNSYFEANGSKTEVQMSVAALKILDQPKTLKTPGLDKVASWSVMKLDGVQVTNQKDLDNEMDDLQKLIRDLSKEAQKKQSAKAVSHEPILETTEIPATVEIPAKVEIPAAVEISAATESPAATEIPSAIEISAVTESPIANEMPAPNDRATYENPAALGIPKTTENLKAAESPADYEEVTVDESECEVTWTEEVAPKQTEMETECTIVPGTPIEKSPLDQKEPQAMNETVQTSTGASSKSNDPQTPVFPKKTVVSPRHGRTPSRVTTPARPNVRAQSQATGTATPAPKKPFVVGKATIPAAPRQIPVLKLKVIDTVPFPQPKPGVPRGVVTQIRTPFRPSVAGSSGQGYGGVPRNPILPSRDSSRTSLSRSNSYRQLFQIKQQVTPGYIPTSPAQAPIVTNSFSSVSPSIYTAGYERDRSAHELIRSSTPDSPHLASVASSQGSTISSSIPPATPRKNSLFWPF